MTRALALILLLSAGLLTGCAELPLMEGTISAGARARAAPDLVPLDPILAEGSRTSRAQAAQGPLQARGAALSSASTGASMVSGTGSGTGDLSERGRQLRERAARLRAEPV